MYSILIHKLFLRFGSEWCVTRAAGRLFIGWPTRLVIRVFAENLVGLGFLWSVFLYKTNPNPRKTICCGKKWPKCHFLTYFFLGWVVALGWGVRRFHSNIYMFSNPTEFGISQTPYCSHYLDGDGLSLSIKKKQKPKHVQLQARQVRHNRRRPLHVTARN